MLPVENSKLDLKIAGADFQEKFRNWLLSVDSNCSPHHVMNIDEHISGTGCFK